MNRRNFLRATMALAVSATLPLPALAIRPKPELMVGEIGSFESVRWIQRAPVPPAYLESSALWSIAHSDFVVDLKNSKDLICVGGFDD